jgi:predicted O-methyltransferase YrrM
MGSLTRRQAAGTWLAAGLGAGAVAAALLDRLTVAVALLGLTGTLLFLAVLQVRRRLAEVQSGTNNLTRAVRSWTRAAESTRRQSADLLETTGQSLENQVLRQLRDQTQEVEALVQLYRLLDPRAPMPSSGHWALNPTELLELWSVIELRRPRLVLELGSGVSSVWIGYALERHRGRLVSLEHDPAYAERTRAHLRRHGLADVAEVRDAPLRPVSVDGESYRWYDPAALAGLSGVDLLLVDGPPGGTGPQARYPALPMLERLLSPRAWVLLDDVGRPEEREILRRWVDTVDGLRREPGTIGQVAVLSYNRRPAEVAAVVPRAAARAEAPTG